MERNARALAGVGAQLLTALSTRLYWRTFVLIVLLATLSVLAWYQSFRALELPPRLNQMRRLVTGTIELSRLALRDTDPARRAEVFEWLAARDEIHVVPRTASDRWVPLEPGDFNDQLIRAIDSRLHEHVLFARELNTERGLWVGYTIGGAGYWLRADRARGDSIVGETWVIGGTLATLLALLGAAIIAGFVNRPLRDLSQATARIRVGDFSQQLDEGSGTREIREVNRGFNRMARALREHEQERALMLAGISHDIRTPLARLRLEAELSVPDPRARRDIVSDIEQADAIISKFMEYASSTTPVRERVDIGDLLAKVIGDYAGADDLRVALRAEPGVSVMADPLELQRVVRNLVENARRYGRTPDTPHAELEIDLSRRGGEIVLSVRDHGPGVPAEQLPMLTRPFFRGNHARPADRGTGLGLAIVDKNVIRMGGRLVISNARGGGLLLRVWLPRDIGDDGTSPT